MEAVIFRECDNQLLALEFSKNQTLKLKPNPELRIGDFIVVDENLTRVEPRAVVSVLGDMILLEVIAYPEGKVNFSGHQVMKLWSDEIGYIYDGKNYLQSRSEYHAVHVVVKAIRNPSYILVVKSVVDFLTGNEAKEARQKLQERLQSGPKRPVLTIIKGYFKDKAVVFRKSTKHNCYYALELKGNKKFEIPMENNQLNIGDFVIIGTKKVGTKFVATFVQKIDPLAKTKCTEEGLEIQTWVTFDSVVSMLGEDVIRLNCEKLGYVYDSQFILGKDFQGRALVNVQVLKSGDPNSETSSDHLRFFVLGKVDNTRRGLILAAEEQSANIIDWDKMGKIWIDSHTKLHPGKWIEYDENGFIRIIDDLRPTRERNGRIEVNVRKGEVEVSAPHDLLDGFESFWAAFDHGEWKVAEVEDEKKFLDDVIKFVFDNQESRFKLQVNDRDLFLEARTYYNSNC